MEHHPRRKRYGLQTNSYDMLNSWHQKHFGRMPEYEVCKGRPFGSHSDRYLYTCTLRYFVPENDRGIWTDQCVTVQGNTRSEARTKAASEAYRFLVGNGLWVNLKDAEIEPKLEDAINQLQELYQKKMWRSQNILLKNPSTDGTAPASAEE